MSENEVFHMQLSIAGVVEVLTYLSEYAFHYTPSVNSLPTLRPIFSELYALKVLHLVL